MVVPERASHWDYFHLLGSFEDKQKFNYAVKLYLIFVDEESDEGTREYILSRVIQALGALSNSMRAGAFSLFCTLLNQSPQLCSYEAINKLIKNHLKPSGNMKSDAEGNVGQILAYKALIESNFVKQNPTVYSEIADGLMDLCTRKSYLHSESLHLLSRMSEITAQEFGTDEFIRHLSDLNNSTIDKLQYLLKLDQVIENSETVLHVFDGKRLISPDTAAEIGILLSKCNSLPEEFVKDFSSAVSNDRKYVSKFWKSYEQNTKDKLDARKGFLSCYYTLLSAFLRLIEGKKLKKTIKTLVSHVAIESLLKYSKEKPDLTKMTCKAILDALTSANDSTLCREVIETLVLNPGNFSFDEETGTKVVGSALRLLATEDIKDFGDKCLDAAIKGESVKNKDRLNALNMYCSLLNKPACLLETEWRVKGMKALLTAGIVNKDNVSSELASIIRKSFFNLLSIKFPTLLAYSDALKELFKCCDKFLTRGKPLKIKVSDEMRESWKLSRKLTSDLEENHKAADQGNKVVIQALQLFTYFIALKSIYEPKESQFNLTDIQSVTKRITQRTSDSEGPEWIEVLLDLFLNMLSKPNSSNRNIINIVFKTVVPHLNDSAFLQLTAILDPAYDLNKTANEEDEEIQGESEASEDESLESSDDDEDDDEKSSDDEGTDNDDMDQDIDDDNSKSFNQEKLQFELRKALMPADDSDNESVNIDDLNTEQGKQLDATLSAIFKNAMVKKKPSKRESITSHFRTRVIDLLETYCLTGMNLDHWLEVIPTVLKLANSLVPSKNSSGLRQRILGFIRRISSVKISDISSEECHVNLLVDLVQKLITEASTASGTVKDLKQHYLEFIKFSIRNTNYVHANNLPSMKDSLSKVIESAVASFFCEKNSLQLELMMFLCQYNWCGVHDNIPTIIDLTFAPTTKHFKRVQGISLLTAYFKCERIFTSMSDNETKSIKKLPTKLLSALNAFATDGHLDEKTEHLLSTLVVDMANSKCSSHFKWKQWKEQLPQIFSRPRASRFNKAFETMCKKFDLSIDNFATREGCSPTEQPPKKKQKIRSPENQNRKRKVVDVRKLKKESKRLRLAAMDGLENLPFSKMVIDV